MQSTEAGDRKFLKVECPMWRVAVHLPYEDLFFVTQSMVPALDPFVWLIAHTGLHAFRGQSQLGVLALPLIGGA